MTDLDTAARRIRDAFDQDLAGYHTPADLAERAMTGGLRRARRRKRLPAAAGLTAATAAAALTVTTLLPGASGAPSALAAWSVYHRGGSIVIAWRKLRDPAGLQRKLRAEGVPANVSVGTGIHPPHCRDLGTGSREWNQVVPFVRPGGPATIVIRPAAITPGTGIAIMGIRAPKLTGEPGGQGIREPVTYSRRLFAAYASTIVRASPQCTGS
jgi:hypothetical protein